MFDSASLDKIESAFTEGKKIVSVSGLHGSSRAALFLEVQKRLDRSLLIVTPDSDTSETLQKDLRFFIHWQKLKKSLHSFPNWEILPYEPLSPFQEIVGERLASLSALSEGKADLVVATASALLQKVIPKKILKDFSFELSAGESVEMELILTCLTESGYEQSDLTEVRGDYSRRGCILDVFPPDAALPVRLEFFGDQIESIRRYDPDTQRSVGTLKKIKFLPTRELVINKTVLERGCAEIEKRANSEAEKKQAGELMEKFRNVFPFPASEIYASYFYAEPQTIFDYLGKDTLIILEEPDLIASKGNAYEASIEEGYSRSLERGDFPPSVEERYLGLDDVQAGIEKFSRMENRLIDTEPEEGRCAFSFEVKSVDSYKGRFREFAAQVRKWRQQGFQKTIVAPTTGEVRRTRELLMENETDCDAVAGDISTGFILPQSKFAIVAEHEIFGVQHSHRVTPGKQKGRRLFRGFQDLKPGDLVVHIDYGVGEFVGVKTLDDMEDSAEFLELLYADREKLYLPMDRLDLLQKYFGADKSAVDLDKLGGVSWKKNKEKVRRSIMEMAQDLLKLYAARKVAQGHAFAPDTFMHKEFEDSFAYTETPDQARAIEEVRQGLESEKPMDRLICGDVGYGKTEVAMRAAFKVVNDGKQVALLAPTTILTQQHLQTFRERFRAYPVNVDLLNRFRSPKEQKETIKKTGAGEVDILIGTHRLLQKDLRFKDLGLVIIDEEQRFGVKHKEKLKEFRKQVDVLTLTATPIPRTLHFSMMGLRDLSIIETPPRDRLAIKTYIRKFDAAVIREAILRETGRNGQVFFLHNRVESIHSMAEYIRKLVPKARIDVAHGQMKEHGLEKVMMRFLDKEIDVLVCTTIIESGLDIPNVNTIIINRADKFGLAQLYQLRGRVGRYRHQAHAYLLIPGELVLENDTRKRLRAIEELSGLGAGFHLAARDLEIRGTGNLLGHQQSGHITAVGFEMYNRLMSDTVREIKGEKTEESVEPDVVLDYKGVIPRSYIPVLNQRLEVYRRLYMAKDHEQLLDLTREVVDRYGPMPLQAKKMLAILEIKVVAKRIFVSELKQRRDKVYFHFSREPGFASGKLLDLVKKLKGRLTLLPESRMTFETSSAGWEMHFRELKGLIRLLEGMRGEEEK